MFDIKDPKEKEPINPIIADYFAKKYPEKFSSLMAEKDAAVQGFDQANPTPGVGKNLLMGLQAALSDKETYNDIATQNMARRSAARESVLKPFAEKEQSLKSEMALDDMGFDRQKSAFDFERGVKKGEREDEDYKRTSEDRDSLKSPTSAKSTAYQDALIEWSKEVGKPLSEKMIRGKSAEDLEIMAPFLKDAAKKKKKKQELYLKTKAATTKATKPRGLTQNMIKTLNERNTNPIVIGDLDSLIDQNKNRFGPVAGRLGGANPYDTDSQAINSKLKASSQAFGKYMEGGVLRKEDEVKYEKMFPQLKDTPEVASRKLEIVRDMLQKKQQSDLDAFQSQGYDLEGLELPEDAPSPADAQLSNTKLNIGAVEDGYRYIGGDPSDQDSWEKL